MWYDLKSVKPEVKKRNVKELLEGSVCYNINVNNIHTRSAQ